MQHDAALFGTINSDFSSSRDKQSLSDGATSSVCEPNICTQTLSHHTGGSHLKLCEKTFQISTTKRTHMHFFLTQPKHMLKWSSALYDLPYFVRRHVALIIDVGKIVRISSFEGSRLSLVFFSFSIFALWNGRFTHNVEWQLCYIYIVCILKLSNKQTKSLAASEFTKMFRQIHEKNFRKTHCGENIFSKLSPSLCRKSRRLRVKKT